MSFFIRLIRTRSGTILGYVNSSMFFIELLLALVIAFTVSFIFAFGFRRSGLWPSFLLFFLIIFLFTWAGGVWLYPVGPTIKGVFWVPFLVMALLVALFMAAATPRTYLPPRTSESRNLRQARRREVNAFLGLFFWILVAILIGAIAVRYLL